MNRRKFIAGAGGIGAATIGGAAILSGSAAAQLGGSIDIKDPETVSVDDGSYQFVTLAMASVYEWQGFQEPATLATFVSELRLPEDDEPGDDEWHELYNATIPLAELASGERGGSLDWTTGEGYNGVLHTGVGDHDQILDDHVENFDRDHDLDDAWDALEPQSGDSRWPVLVSPDYGGELYSVPDPLETDAPEATEDGGDNETLVQYRKTVIVHDDGFDIKSNDPAEYDSAAEVSLDTKFEVSIDNIDSDTTGTGSGDATVETDDEKTAD